MKMKKYNHETVRHGYIKSPKNLFQGAVYTILLLSLTSCAAAGDDGSPAYAASLSSASVKISPVAAVSPARETAQVPRQLEAFARDTVAALAQHAPFHSWSSAGLSYMPLGPGTHSWLVTLEDEGKPLGYLIITGDTAGGFTLSEYGLGTDLPYSMAPLINSLAASRIIIPSESAAADQRQPASLPPGSRAVALYVPAAPYWKVTVQDSSKPVYIHAVTYEILPSAPTARKETDIYNPNSNAVTAVSVAGKSGSPNVNRKAANWKADAPALSDQDAQPYHNLAWLTSPKLQVRKGSDLTRLLPAGSGKSLTFTAASKRNAQYAAPFSLTGWQRWTVPSSESIYVAVPHPDLDMMRFIPADYLIPSGNFHPNPNE